MGQDIFTFNGHNPHLREVGVQRDGTDQLLKVELGKERNGLELAIPLHFASSPKEQGGGGLQEKVNTGMEFSVKTKGRQPEDKVEWSSDL